MTQETEVVRLAQFFFGPKVEIVFNEKPPFLWNGETLHYSCLPNLLHEIAHFQLAPRWRRRMTAYGLGLEPEGSSDWKIRERVPYVVSDKRCGYEEELASLLGILWEKKLDFPWWETALSHSWLDYCDPVHVKDFAHLVARRKVVERLAHLLDIGLIDSDFIPQPKLAGRWRVRKTIW